MVDGTIREFTDLVVWQEAHKLVLEIYRVSKDFPNREEFGLRSQICRATVSITSNIAEGFSRYHYKDKVNFYYDARGSLSEVLNQLIIARDLKYIPSESFEKLASQVNRVFAILNGLIKRTRNSNP